MIREVPEPLDLMAATALQCIDHGDFRGRGIEPDLPNVAHGITEPLIAIVTCDKSLRSRCVLECLELGLSLPRPHERTDGLRLVEPVDAHGIVSRGTTKIITPLFLRMKGISARIN